MFIYACCSLLHSDNSGKMVENAILYSCCSLPQDMEAAQLMQQADAVSPASSSRHFEVTFVV
jgi:hypothetical protein